MFGATQRLLAIVVALVAAGPMMPSVSSAQPPGTRTLSCAILTDPEELSDLDFEDFLHLMAICPGLIASVKAEESRSIVRAPGVKETERKEKVRVRRAAAGSGGAAPQIVSTDPEALAEQNGFSIRQKNETEIRETPDSRYEKREEKTRIRGDDFDYDLEESRERTEEPGFRSDERESEERLRAG